MRRNLLRTSAKGNRVPRPEPEWQHFGCERLVSDEIWEEAQRLAGTEPGASSAAQTGPRVVHPFAGLAICACGEKAPSCLTKIATDDLEGIFQDELGARQIKISLMNAAIEHPQNEG